MGRYEGCDTCEWADCEEICDDCIDESEWEPAEQSIDELLEAA
jgi:hypothetical protein